MYATADDMRARFGEDQLVQLVNGVAWDATVIAAINIKLSSATALADGYVAKYYDPAPGRAIPPLLVELVCDMAYARLHRELSETEQQRLAQAMKTLDNISKGLVKIDGGAQDIPARSNAVIVPDAVRTFSRDRLGGF